MLVSEGQQSCEADTCQRRSSASRDQVLHHRSKENSQRWDGSSELGVGGGHRSGEGRDERSPGRVSRNAGTPSLAWKRPKDHIFHLGIHVRGPVKISFWPHGQRMPFPDTSCTVTGACPARGHHPLSISFIGGTPQSDASYIQGNSPNPN